MKTASVLLRNFKRVVRELHVCIYKTNYFRMLRFEVNTLPTGCRKEVRVIIARFTIAYFAQLFFCDALVANISQKKKKKKERKDSYFVFRFLEVFLCLFIPLRLRSGKSALLCDIVISTR